MGSYVPSTAAEREEMLRTVGLNSAEELYSVVPPQLRLKHLNIPAGISELELSARMKALADKNRIFPAIFRGAGAYDHYIPAIVNSVCGKEEFLTAYTPYQAEISQGVLQSIFEYQTMICELTGMEVANASVYDGATAAAEAAAMCLDRKRRQVLVSAAANPMLLETVRTYCFGTGAEYLPVPVKDGKTDPAALAELAGAETACLIVQQPNYFGLLEDMEELGAAAHAAGAKFVMSVNPIAAALLKTPAECGADIAVGEGQPLGMPLAFGGPYLGFMAATKAMMRKLPGRIVGETKDDAGRRAYVLTLQAREQHIRREKASSNICSNEALCALRAAVYLATMGQKGLHDAALQCYSKAHYLAAGLSAIPGFELVYPGDFFHEFVSSCPVEREVLLAALEEKGILGGLPVKGGLLWCCTEKNSKAQIDLLLATVKEVCGK